MLPDFGLEEGIILKLTMTLRLIRLDFRLGMTRISIILNSLSFQSASKYVFCLFPVQKKVKRSNLILIMKANDVHEKSQEE